MFIPSYIDSNSPNAEDDFSEYMSRLILRHGKIKDIVIVCIGTDRATGDALGPLTGTMLCDAGVKNVFGTLSAPVHALNLDETVERIYKSFKKPLVVAVDASLGTNGHIGCVTLSDEPLRPGAGVNKKLAYVGDIAVTGIVNSWGVNPLSVLQSTRLSLVVNMSKMLADGIFLSLKKMKKLKCRKKKNKQFGLCKFSVVKMLTFRK